MSIEGSDAGRRLGSALLQAELELDRRERQLLQATVEIEGSVGIIAAFQVHCQDQEENLRRVEGERDERQAELLLEQIRCQELEAALQRVEGERDGREAERLREHLRCQELEAAVQRLQGERVEREAERMRAQLRCEKLEEAVKRLKEEADAWEVEGLAMQLDLEEMGETLKRVRDERDAVDKRCADTERVLDKQRSDLIDLLVELKRVRGRPVPVKSAAPHWRRLIEVAWEEIAEVGQQLAELGEKRQEVARLQDALQDEAITVVRVTAKLDRTRVVAEDNRLELEGRKAALAIARRANVRVEEKHREMGTELTKVRTKLREAKKALAAPSWQVTPTQLIPDGDLEPIRHLGAGCFGTVVLCNSLRYGPVAVKQLQMQRTATDAKEFTREAQRLSTLNHPNVMRTFGVVTDGTAAGQVTGIASEFVRGGDLDRRIMRCMMPLGMRERCRLALGGARGMAYLHARDLVHLDLKPANLLLDEDDCVKVADLGLCLRTSEAAALPGVRGTIAYMAPELANQLGATPKSDVYSFGIIMWQMYVQQLPFAKLDLRETFARMRDGSIIEELRAPLVGCEAAWTSLVQQCVQIKADLRPSFADLVSTLEALLDTCP